MQLYMYICMYVSDPADSMVHTYSVKQAPPSGGYVHYYDHRNTPRYIHVVMYVCLSSGMAHPGFEV
jgi:hypothetical protein